MDELLIEPEPTERELGTAPIKPLFARYAAITFAGMLAQMVMVVLEGLIIGNGLGPLGLAAVTVILPLELLNLALGGALGMGTAAAAGQRLGSGDTAGAQNFRTITRYASSIGVKYLTLYAFSTENWSRPAEEVSALMKLFHQYLEEALRDFMNENIRVRFIGDISAFAPDLQALIHRVEEASSVKTGMVLNLAMNYGGRAEITRAARILAERVKNGELSPEDITEETLSGAMYTAGQPDPDLIIRPSGEERISNFLLWQSAYTEFEYFDILWPDFKPKHLDEAIEKFNSRQRRFGGV